MKLPTPIKSYNPIPWCLPLLPSEMANTHKSSLYYGSLFNSFLCEAKNPYLAAPPQELTQDLGHDHPLLQHLYR